MINNAAAEASLSDEQRILYREHGYSFGWLPEPEDPKDYRYGDELLGAEQPTEIPERVDLRAEFPLPFDQGPALSCSAQAIASALQYLRKKQALTEFTPSRLYIWWNERVIEGSTQMNVGAYLRDGIKSVDTQGFCKEEIWPYDLGNFRSEPPAEAFEQGKRYKAIDYYKLDNMKLDELRACLAAGYPFVFGFAVFSSIFTAEVNGGIIPVPGPDESRLGGHAVLAVGYDNSKNLLILRNSWGATKGDAGYYYLPYAYVTNPSMCTDFWTIRLVTSLGVPPL